MNSELERGCVERLLTVLGGAGFTLDSPDPPAPDVRVTWPGGDTGGWQHLSADQFAILDRATGTATRWSPG